MPSQIHLTKLFRLFVLLPFVGAVWSCEEPVDLDLQALEPELVVSSAFFPGETVKVRLSSTFPAVGEQVLTDITDATVSILEGNDVAEVLRYVPGTDGAMGSYQSRDFIPVVGRTYTLYATKNGYLPFEAASSIPEPVAISDLTVSNVHERMIGGLSVFDFDLTINYDDPDFEANYYDLRISQIVQPYYINAQGDTVKLAFTAKTLETPDVDPTTNTAPGETSILVRDRPEAGGLTISLQSRYNPTNEILLDLVAELRTVSENYFDYQVLRQREGMALPIGIGDPGVSSFSQRSNRGVGVFAGYNRVIRTFSLHQ